MSETTTTAEEASGESSVFGLDQNLAGALAYLFWPIVGIVFYVMADSDDEFTRFHAMQAIIVGVIGIVVVVVLSLIPVIGSIVGALINIVLWAFLTYKAYSGEMYELPGVGGFAHNQV